jgi:hypothetical protein
MKKRTREQQRELVAEWKLLNLYLKYLWWLWQFDLTGFSSPFL